MKRTQVQLDEVTFEHLRRQAFERGVSRAALIREVLQEKLGVKTRRHLRDFTFIASGRSGDGGPMPISEKHDEALAEDFGR